MDVSERGRSNRRRGLDAERAVARHLRTVGFPGAERAVRTGFTTDDRNVADPGDITGIPGVVIQVKAVAREDIASWMQETQDQAEAAQADLGLLVQRRAGKAAPGRWWVWLDLASLALLAGSRTVCEARPLVRMELDDLLPLLIAAGFGTREKVA